MVESASRFDSASTTRMPMWFAVSTWTSSAACLVMSGTFPKSKMCVVLGSASAAGVWCATWAGWKFELKPLGSTESVG